MPIHVLVIDDNPITRKLVRLALAAEGFRVHEAATGAEGLACARTDPPDLILQDWVLPDMDGLELLRALRALPGGAEAPILAFTGLTTAVERARGMPGGFTDFLVKPVEPSRLVATIRAHVRPESRVHGRPGAGLTLLVVDDDPVQGKLIRLLLTHVGFQVLGAADGVEALATARRERPDAIVSDVLMPHMDGFRLCESVRRDPALVATPVILLSSAYTEAADVDLARAVGADAMLTRVPEPQELVREILAALDRPRRVTSSRSAELVAGDYLRRVLAQLDRQAAQGRRMSQRLGIAEARLAIVTMLPELLRTADHHGPVLEGLLAPCLDAAGVSRGAIVLLEGDAPPAIGACRGFDATAEVALRELAGRAEFREHCFATGAVALGAPGGSAEAHAMAVRCGVPLLLVAPMTGGGRRVGLLALGCDADGLDADGCSFAEAVANQIAQALAVLEGRDRLSESEARFRQMAEAIEHVFFLTTPDQSELLYVSPAYTRMFGRSVESLHAEPRSWLDAIHRDDRVRVEQELVAAAAGSGTSVHQFRVVRPDGTVRWIRSRAFGIPDAAGRLYRLAGVAEDVTALQDAEAALGRSERALRQAQKMEAVGRLAGGVAHDFNNILTGILGYSDLVLARLNRLDPLRADIEEVRKLGERATGLTRQLLAFSRQQVLEPRVLDPNGVLTGLQRMLGRLIGEDVALVVDAKATGRVKVDPGQLEQVLMNLAVNARDAMPRGGRLTLETHDEEIDAVGAAAHPGLPPGAYVTVAVTDTGTGMDAETQAHLFEPFFTTKALGQGTGLGLSTVYGIVAQSGGHVRVYSEVGKGSTFRVYLPRVEAVAQAHPAAPPPEVRGGHETIVLVEDEATVRALARRVLAEAGYRVLEARTGKEALGVVLDAATPIDCVLTDVVMPDLGGPELARRLDALRPGTRTIFMSGYTAQGVVHIGEVPEGAVFLPKPFTAEQLLRRIREVLDAPARAVVAA